MKRRPFTGCINPLSSHGLSLQLAARIRGGCIGSWGENAHCAAILHHPIAGRGPVGFRLVRDLKGGIK